MTLGPRPGRWLSIRPRVRSISPATISVPLWVRGHPFEISLLSNPFLKPPPCRRVDDQLSRGLLNLQHVCTICVMVSSSMNPPAGAGII
jgi:hypothetical protein